MSQRTQEELQRQLVKLGWTIGQQPQYPNAAGEVIPLRQLATITLREQSPANALNRNGAKRKTQPTELHKPKQ